MLGRLYIIAFTLVWLTFGLSTTQAQSRKTLARQSLYKGDTILSVDLRPVYVYKPLKFKNKRQQQNYSRLVRNVKKTLPIAKEIKGIIIQTSLTLDTTPLTGIDFILGYMLPLLPIAIGQAAICFLQQFNSFRLLPHYNITLCYICSDNIFVDFVICVLRQQKYRMFQ